MSSGSPDNISGPIPCRRFIEQCNPSVTAGVNPGGSSEQTLVTNFPNSSYTCVTPVGNPVLTFKTEYTGSVTLNSISCFPGWNFITTGFDWNVDNNQTEFFLSFVGSQGVPMFSVLTGLPVPIQSPTGAGFDDHKIQYLNVSDGFTGQYSFSRWIYCGLTGEGQTDDLNVTDINKLTVSLAVIVNGGVGNTVCKNFFLSAMSMNSLIANGGIA